MTMMHMPWVLVTLMIFLVLVAGGAFIAIRQLAAKSDSRDHPESKPRVDS